jgi:hypothetical protein
VRRTALGLCILGAWAAGCGGSAEPAAPPPLPDGDPLLGRAPVRPGEIVIRGDASPASYGPYALSGTYSVAFEQYAPEDPSLDFGTQTSFVVRLDRDAEIARSDSIRLFSAAQRTGRRRLRVDGTYFVDVDFGDFPYVIRLRPLRSVRASSRRCSRTAARSSTCAAANGLR